MIKTSKHVYRFFLGQWFFVFYLLLRVAAYFHCGLIVNEHNFITKIYEEYTDKIHLEQEIASDLSLKEKEKDATKLKEIADDLQGSVQARIQFITYSKYLLSSVLRSQDSPYHEMCCIRNNLEQLFK